MTKRPSMLETNRRNGKTQVMAQRNCILDSAEKSFLERGLENVNMQDIAISAGINRSSLYRYFPDQAPIAFEIAVRMLRKILHASGIDDRAFNLKNFRQAILNMIDQFFEVRDAFRYITCCLARSSARASRTPHPRCLALLLARYDE